MYKFNTLYEKYFYKKNSTFYNSHIGTVHRKFHENIILNKIIKIFNLVEELKNTSHKIPLDLVHNINKSMRLNRSKQVKNRIMHEINSYVHKKFITLNHVLLYELPLETETVGPYIVRISRENYY